MTVKRVIVTGGSRSIGAAISRRFASLGADVLIVHRSDVESAEKTVAAIREAGGRAEAVQINLVHAEEIRRLFEEHAGERVDVLVHCAAIGSFKPLLEVRANQWDLTMSVNVRAFHLCAVEAARRMPDGGCIIALSSAGATEVIPHYGAIGVSKAALEATVRYLASELAPRGIAVRSLAPDLVENTSIQVHPHYDALRATAIARSPNGRLLRAEEVADDVVRLCAGWREEKDGI